MKRFITTSSSSWVVAFSFAIAAVASPSAVAQDVIGKRDVISKQDVIGKEETRVIHLASGAGAAASHIWLPLNKGVVIELDRDARDVFAGSPGIVDAVVSTPRRIYLTAQKVGETNAVFMDAQGRQIGAVEISVGQDVTSLNDQLAREIPNAKVQAQALNDNVVLSGSVNTLQDASRAQDLAERFTGKAEKVVNNLAIDQRQQVLIQVRVSEMSRTISKQLGLDATYSQNIGGVPVFVGTDNQFSLLGRALSDISGAVVGQTCSPMPCPAPNNVQAQLKALERIGLVHTLAEPNLTAVSGEAAKFLAGGEFPVPVGRDRDGNITVEYKQFGVGLSFTPVVLSKGRISLQISTEVSELTNVGALKLVDVTLPGLSVRRAQTTVELPSGGNLAIGGLIQQQTKQNIDGLPGVKDLPVLGALFRSRDFQNNESELVVTVTAYLVNPVAPGAIAHPDDGYAVPTDLETILLGRLNAVYGKDAKLPPDVPRNSVGYIVQ
jgi:pilus assembly protein CpaC